MMEIEGLYYENKGREIGRVDAENKGVDAENEGVDNKVLPPEQKLYLIRNPPTINYNYERTNHLSMGGSNMIVGSHALRNFAKAYVNVINVITNFLMNQPHQPTSSQMRPS